MEERPSIPLPSQTEIFDAEIARMTQVQVENERVILERNKLIAEAPKYDGIKIGIGVVNGFVMIDFNGPTKKILMTKKQAREFCRRLSKVTL